MIQVAFISFTDLRTGAGTENVVLNYVKYANPERVKVHVIDTDWIYDGVAFKSNSEVDSALVNSQHIQIHSYVAPFAFLNRHVATRLLFELLFSSALYRIIGRIVYRKLFNDLSKLDFVFLMDNPYAMCFPRKKGTHQTKLIATSHCFNPTKSKVTLLKIIPFTWFNKVDCIHLFPNQSQSEILFAGKTTILLPNGVDTSLYDINASRHDKLRFLFVARLTKSKGILRVMAAWQRFKVKDKAELHIVGGGPLSDAAAHSSLQGVFYHGILTEDQLADIYRSSDVFIYPTSADVFPLSVNQALSSGLYCILGDSLKGLYDEFVSIGCAEYIDPDDIDAMSSKMNDILCNQTTITQGKQRCRELMISKYSWQSIVSNMYEMLEKMKTQSSSG